MIAEKFEKVLSGEIKRLIVNMPPRHTKSEFASYLFPAWLLGHKPQTKIIQTTHTAELSYRFGRKVRNLIDSNDYAKVFQDVKLSEDSKAAGRWETNHGGEYFGAGVGGAITGRGADLLIIDDPHSEQDALSSTAMDNTWEWYTSGPRQRLQPGGSIVCVMTRWSDKDLTGQLQKAMSEVKADQWDIIEFPAILPSGKPVWPNYWKLEELEAVKASLTEQKWQAQWQQNPTGEEGALIKRDWWQVWDRKDIPMLSHVIQSYDTAFTKKETGDYSAISTWGVFYPDEVTPNILLLDCIKERYEFPELKRAAIEQYKYWEPETVIVEAKASGLPLIQELRALGIPVINFTPSKGNDKVSRVHAVAPLFESGVVWIPDERWAEEMVEECAQFPFGEHDDLVDSMTQALMRFRQGNFVRLFDDEEEEPTDHGETEYY
jgi:predicted phage terminase large subunit-like protein